MSNTGTKGINLLGIFIALTLKGLVNIKFKSLIYLFKRIIFYNIVIPILGKDSDRVGQIFNFLRKNINFLFNEFEGFPRSLGVGAGLDYVGVDQATNKNNYVAKDKEGNEGKSVLIYKI